MQFLLYTQFLQPSQDFYCLKYILKCLLFLLSFFLLAKKFYKDIYTHTHMTKTNARHLQHFAKWKKKKKTEEKKDFEISGFEM